MGLHKSAAYLASPAACRLRRGDNIGALHRFKIGHIPVNKGQKGWQAGGRSRETQFKKGHLPKNYALVSAERLSKDGYRQRKITDTGYPPRDWKSLHVMLWEEHHGPVPAGHNVMFRDGDKVNITIENLALISRADNMRRNTIHRYPHEVKQVIRLANKLTRMTKEPDSEK